MLSRVPQLMAGCSALRHLSREAMAVDGAGVVEEEVLMLCGQGLTPTPAPDCCTTCSGGVKEGMLDSDLAQASTAAKATGWGM
jgi:hypothetical protein